MVDQKLITGINLLVVRVHTQLLSNDQNRTKKIFYLPFKLLKSGKKQKLC